MLKNHKSSGKFYDSILSFMKYIFPQRFKILQNGLSSYWRFDNRRLLFGCSNNSKQLGKRELVKRVLYLKVLHLDMNKLTADIGQGRQHFQQSKTLSYSAEAFNIFLGNSQFCSVIS